MCTGTYTLLVIIIKEYIKNFDLKLLILVKPESPLGEWKGIIAPMGFYSILSKPNTFILSSYPARLLVAG
jgi:hypothetical protein